MIQRMSSIREITPPEGARRTWRRSGRRVCRRVGQALLVALSLCGCQEEHRDEAAVEWRPPRANQDGPTVRIRIGRNLSELRLATSGDVLISPGAAQQATRSFKSPVSVQGTAHGFAIRDASGAAVEWRHSVLEVTDAAGGGIWIDGRGYPGTVRLHAAVAAACVDAVNHVPMESYLPGVLDRELLPHWRDATFVAQAIAARSYAMHEMSKGRRKHFDLESTTASQAYAGITGNPRAHHAVRATRGMMLTYRGQVLRAYYSSCCGGVGQDAALAFPNSRDAAPLRGREHGPWCAQSRFYRWGPISRPTATLGRRLALWGKAKKHAIAALRGLTSITVTRRNAAGRPARFTVTDRSRRTFTLAAESFRHACNRDDPALTSLSQGSRLPSAHVRVAVEGSTVRFTDGRGHGHGVGMCQYGGEALAKAGYNAASILGFYYQGARIESIY